MSNDNEQKVVAGTWNGKLAPPKSTPQQADIVIIGGGIVGVSTAWFLARQGVNVVLCEKGFIAGEQSGRNWGWVRQQGRDHRELPMMIESMRIFRELEDEIGENVGYGGSMMAADTELTVSTVCRSGPFEVAASGPFEIAASGAAASGAAAPGAPASGALTRSRSGPFR